MDTSQSSESYFETACRGFACPQEHLDRSFLDTIVCELGRETVRRFLEQHRASFNQPGQYVTDYLESWLGNEDIDLATCWHDTFGYVHWLLTTRDQNETLRSCAALALHLSASGHPGDWTINLDSLMQCRWSNWLLPRTDRLAVSSDGVVATVVTSSGPNRLTIRFTRFGTEWLAQSGDPIPLPQIGVEQSKIVLLPGTALADIYLDETLPPFVENIAGEITSLWQDSLTLISRHAPSYVAWIHSVVRYVALLETTAGVVYSGSYPYRYGLIHASARSSVMSLAELLVHEASHQYFYMLSWLCPVDDGTDSKLYYSPLVARYRPLNRILFAYHACANILLLYRVCQENGAPETSEYCTQHEDEVVKQLDQLSSALSNNPALTWAGRTLYDSLAKRVA